ncbi:P-loop NTPase fold protein [Priestia megaterium]|uniref:P-loop NTPase fold protein n=1 Tax=Priestia megaterium TaxID=1404 RepID=UPI002DBA7C98|nr:P-loop NTPase fold protein [Priestia megaterium]MEC1071396.1 P-loop NTPase fold protein [Priestia megaterium]
MKILIKHKFINDAPFNGEEDRIFVFSDDNKEENENENQDKDKFQNFIGQITQEIINGNPTSFLVSGYRGVGKTSFINKVEQEIKKEHKTNHLFIKINLPKYQENSLLLRKIIREVYFSIQKNYDLNKLRHQNQEFITSLELLFERTFNNIEGSQKNSLKQENKSVSNLQINLKKLTVGFLLSVITAINMNYNLINWSIKLKDNGYLNLAMFSIPTVWTAVQLLDIKRTKSKISTDLMEISRKTLYDDEIAEYQLTKILEGLKGLDINPVFIIDELDKINEIEQVELLIGELKPLMLSGLASFILISGQELYYKFNTSNMLDDALIASVFSENIHIPLPSNQVFIHLFEKILDDSEQISREIIEDYVKSRILNSNRLPRKFMHLVKKDLKWQENRAYLKFDDNEMKAFRTDARLLDIILLFIEKELLGLRYEEGIIDFFTTQLHIWVKKMKLSGNQFFHKDDIYNLEDDYKSSHPNRYFDELNRLIVRFLERLSEADLLEKKIEKLENKEDITYYRWTKQVTIQIEEIINGESTTQSQFLANFKDFEGYLRESYEFILGDYQNLSINNMINAMVKENILPEIWITKVNTHDTDIESIIELKKSIIDGRTIPLKHLDNVHIYSDRLLRLKADLIRRYTYFIAKRHLEKNGYKVNKKLHSNFRNRDNFDFEAINQLHTMKANILFEIRANSGRNSIKDIIHNILLSLDNYNKFTGKTNYLIYLVDDENDTKFHEYFSDVLDNEIQINFRHLENYVMIFYFSEHKGTSLHEGLYIYLDEHLKKPILQ